MTTPKVVEYEWDPILKERFDKVAAQVQNLKNKPSDTQLLEIYGLYKQATMGDCKQPKPNALNLKEVAKHESWMRKHGMEQEAAADSYISKARHLVIEYGLKK